MALPVNTLLLFFVSLLLGSAFPSVANMSKNSLSRLPSVGDE